MLHWRPTGRHERHTPATSDVEKKDWTLPDVIAIGLSLSERACCFLTNATFRRLYLATCTLGGQWVSVLTRNSNTKIAAEPHDLGCHVMPWSCCSVFHSATMNGPKYVELLETTLKLHMHVPGWNGLGIVQISIQSRTCVLLWRIRWHTNNR